MKAEQHRGAPSRGQRLSAPAEVCCSRGAPAASTPAPASAQTARRAAVLRLCCGPAVSRVSSATRGNTLEDRGGGGLRERREEAESVEEDEEAAHGGYDQAPVELVAHHGELGVVRVGWVLPESKRRAALG